MDPTETRLLGRTGVALTQLGFGGASIAELFHRVSDEEAAGALDAAWNAGLRYFDTAPWYGRGLSEHRTGNALRRRPRSEYVLSTKVGRILRRPADPDRFESAPWAGGLPFQVVFDYGYDAIMRSYEDSLQRLGIPTVDLLLIHDLDLLYHSPEEKMAAHFARLTTGGFRALEELRSGGLIRGIGAGVNALGMIPRFLDLYDMDFFLVAMPYTLLEQETLDEEFPRCEERGVGIVIGSPYQSGILAAGAVPGANYNYAPAAPEMLDRVRRVQAVCERHGVPLAAAALQFPLGHPIVASVIPGGRNARQVERTVRDFGHPIPPALWDELKAEKLLRADAPVPVERGA